ncbi:Satratoxin biosynthesis SC1 cluster protein 4 [Pseudocercospora fuligena]|uniref:Satratoxin biosynthesis SC1 cluster protein 4 n=1 Tax=Pseudocercospora fuligena TaxID=685502 RepID=A0A8H6RHC3_9PEZI|nr:Satratoxin biosynthesis SC1 cluster protein 4 [Pseudocercospora fuligena]
MVSGHASPEATLAVVFTSTFIAAICVLLRLWTRLGIVRQPGMDDLLVSLSIIFTSTFSMCVAVQVHYGLGKHQDSLSAHNELYLLKWFWASIWNYYLGLGLAKLSMVVQCMRIFGHIPKFRRAAWILGTVIAVFTTWTFFVSVFLCGPISKFWYPNGPGTCLNRLPLWFFNSSFNVATDIATAILPLPVVKCLNLPRKQRRALMAVFGLGGAICTVSCIRFYALYAVATSSDPSWDNPQAALYANLEATVGIIASCLPTLKGLVTKFFPNLFSSTRSGTHERSEEIELSKSGTKASIHDSKNHDRDWNPLPKKKPQKRGSIFMRKHGPGRVKVTQTEIEGGSPSGEESITPKDGEIKVTTIVEQVEGRREWHDSKEDLMPVKPYDTFK